MRWIFLVSFVLFYLFFFIRAALLSRRIGKSIKAKKAALNSAVLATGLSAALFILELFFPSMSGFLGVFHESIIAEYVGLGLILMGLSLSVFSSLGLGRSWRIGVDPAERTELVHAGIYRISRNPYFLSYDIALMGTSIASGAVLVIALSVIAICMFHVLILKEEKYLLQIHKEEYRRYQKEVRRYL